MTQPNILVEQEVQPPKLIWKSRAFLGAFTAILAIILSLFDTKVDSRDWLDILTSDDVATLMVALIGTAISLVGTVKRKRPLTFSPRKAREVKVELRRALPVDIIRRAAIVLLTLSLLSCTKDSFVESGVLEVATFIDGVEKSYFPRGDKISVDPKRDTIAFVDDLDGRWIVFNRHQVSHEVIYNR